MGLDWLVARVVRIRGSYGNNLLADGLACLASVPQDNVLNERIELKVQTNGKQKVQDSQRKRASLRQAGDDKIPLQTVPLGSR